MLVLWAIGAAVTYIMLPVNWFMETIGFLAVFTEAMLGELTHRSSLTSPSDARFCLQVRRNFSATTRTNRRMA